MSTALYLALSHAATSTTVTLSGGTDVFTGVSFRVTKCELGTAPIYTGLTPQRGFYSPVQCAVTVEVLGATADACWSNLSNIYKLFALAQDWYSGNPTQGPVLISFSPDGSTTTSSGSPLTAVLTRPVGQGVQVPNQEPSYSSTGGFTLPGVVLTFERQGEWCYPYSSSSASDYFISAASATNVVVTSASLSALSPGSIPRPAGFGLFLTSGSLGGFTNRPNGALAITSGSSGITVATITASGGQFTRVADSANFPRSGSSITRFTPTGTTVQTLSGIDSGSNLDKSRPVYVLSVRNNSTSYSYRIRLKVYDFTNTGYQYTTWRIVDGSTTNARLVFFPAIEKAYASSGTIDMDVVASASGGTIDFNYLAVIDSSDPGTAIFNYGNTTLPEVVFRNALISDDRSDVIFATSSTAASLTTTAHPTRMPGASTGNALPLTYYSGTTPVIYGDTVYMLAMVSSGSLWCQSTSGSAINTLQHVVMRRNTTVTPR